MKKQVLIVAAVVVVALVGVVVYLYTNLDGIVKRQLESYGSAMTGTRVWVESVAQLRAAVLDAAPDERVTLYVNGSSVFELQQRLFPGARH